MSSGGCPAPIPMHEMDTVRQVVLQSNAEPHPFLQTGNRVRVKTGSLEGVEGILIRKKNQFRLVISVELMGKSVSVEIDASAVDRIQARTAHLPAPV